MSEVVGEEYSDENQPHEEEAPSGVREGGTQPGQGPNDAPASTGTHRGWGDPQPQPDKS